MGIGDIFRPKYRHSDVGIRLEAVRELGPDEAELAIEVAREDDDASVRKLAIGKIEDAGVLLELSKTDADADVSTLARERAVSLLIARAGDGDVDTVRDVAQTLARAGDQKPLVDLIGRVSEPKARRIAMDFISDQKALGELVRSTEDPEIRTEAIDRIDDVEVLRSIAIDEERKAVGYAALARIADRDAIEAISVRGKSKAVRSRAKKTLAGFSQANASVPDLERQRQAERVQLCKLVEKLARGHEWQASYNEVTDAERRWEALGPIESLADEELGIRFSRATERYFEQYDKYKPREGVAVEAEPAADEQPTDVSESADPVEHEHEHEHEPEHEDEHESSTESGGERPKGGKKSGKSDEERAANLAEGEQLCLRLEQLIEAPKLKSLEKKLSQLESKYRSLGPLPKGTRKGIADRWDEARRKVVIRIAELREAEEWKRWANVPKQKELIAKVAALAEQDADQHTANKLKEAQAEWKQLGPAPRDKSQELWTQFKAACDLVYDKVKVFRSHASAQKKDNLRAKEALCEQAEELADSSDWAGTADTLKRLQSEWKSIGPVPRRQSDALWKRFRGACDKFFERRKPHLEKRIADREQNIDAKREVVEAAEALLSSDDIEGAIAQVPDLRDRWRNTGPVPQKLFNELNARFRSACDAIYARRDEAREAERVGLRENVDRLCNEVEAVIGAGEEGAGEEGAGLAGKVVELRAARKEIARDRSEEATALLSRSAGLIEAAVEAQPAAFKGTDLDPETSRKRKQKLCVKIEELIPDQSEEQAPTSAEDMAAKLRAALADRALGGVLSKRPSKESIETSIRDAREAWARLGPVPGPDGAALEQRFEQACERAAKA